MAKITLLELHLDDASLTANAPFSSRGKDVEAAEGPFDDETSSRKGSLVAAVVGLVFLVAVAYVVRKRVLSGGTDEELEIDEIEA